MGLHRAVASLTRPGGTAVLTGAEPVDSDGNPLAPADVWGHDHLWWLDRMVRTNQPLVERMTLVWHDWFATSLEGVSQQQLMLDQNALFRRSALGSFRQLVLDVTANPAMIIWLNLNENRLGRPNENYARELMELFTLGADRGAYGESDVTPGWHARSPAGPTTGARSWARTTSATSPPATTRARRRSSARPAPSPGRRRCRCACRTPCTPPSSSRSCGATSSLPRRPPRSSSPWAGVRGRAATRCGRCSRRSSSTRSCTRVRGWSSRRWCSWPGFCARSASRSTTEDWWWLCQTAGQRLFAPARRGRLGPRALARLGNGARPLADRGAGCSAAATSREPAYTEYDATETAQQAVATALGFWGNPGRDQRDVGRSHQLRRRLRQRRHGELAAAPVPRQRARTRSASSSVPPPTSRCHDADHVRLRRLVPRAPAAERRGSGRPGTSGDRARHAHAGRQRPDPPELRVQDRGTGLRRLRRREPGSQGIRGGHRRGCRRPRRDERVLVSVFLSGGADSMTVLAPTGDPALRDAPPDAGDEPLGGQRLRRRRLACAGIRRLRGLATLHGEGKLTVMPAVGYTGANQSHFTSRHYWEVGETNPNGRWGWLGRFLDRHGADDNPLQGVTLGSALQPVLAASQVPVATVPQPSSYYFYGPGVSDPVAGQMLDAFGDLGELTTADANLAYARRAVATTSRLREQLVPFQNGFTTPVTYPAGTLRGAAQGAGGDDRRRPSAARGGARGRRELRHPRQPGRGPRHAHAGHQLEPAGVPARPRGARTGRPGARARVERVRPAGRGERVGHRPRRRGDGLRDGRQCLGRDDRRVPRTLRSRQRREPAAHVGLPLGLQLAAGAMARRGRRAAHPERGRCSRAFRLSRREDGARSAGGRRGGGGAGSLRGRPGSADRRGRRGPTPAASLRRARPRADAKALPRCRAGRGHAGAVRACVSRHGARRRRASC